MAELFKQRVMNIVRRIPAGDVLSYEEVARRAGRPNAQRAVGNILKKNYDPKIPCHRIVRADGGIGGYNRGSLEKFKKIIWEYYRAHGRKFPWRNTRDPYRILVSEVMLQQTQTDRVVKFYEKFLRAFPSVQSLARAPIRQILAVWQGLGYNRRALYLKRMAEVVVRDYNGKLPRSVEELRRLPGVGPTTAAAVAAFAYDIPSPMIETNIRSVYLHFFFPGRKNVSDKQLLPLIRKTLPSANSCEWYYGLMDYGVHLKKHHPNPSRRSAHHAKQSKFEGSNRQLRGVILKMHTKKSRLSVRTLVRSTGRDAATIRLTIASLKKEGLLD